MEGRDGNGEENKYDSCDCPKGKFYNESTEECSKCPYRYKSCVSETKGLECADNRKNFDCECNDGYYDDSENKTCTQCKYPC